MSDDKREQTAPVPASVKFLSREDILAAKDIELTPLDIPEWGGSVYLRPLNAAQAMELTKEARTNPDNDSVNTMIASVVNERGEQLFTRADLELLKVKSARAFMRIRDQAMVLNGFREPKKTAEAAKNV